MIPCKSSSCSRETDPLRCHFHSKTRAALFLALALSRVSKEFMMQILKGSPLRPGAFYQLDCTVNIYKTPFTEFSPWSLKDSLTRLDWPKSGMVGKHQMSRSGTGLKNKFLNIFIKKGTETKLSYWHCLKDSTGTYTLCYPIWLFCHPKLGLNVPNRIVVGPDSWTSCSMTSGIK